MGELTVSGSFLITIGTGAGPRMWVAVSAHYADGNPFDFPGTPEDVPVKVFIALSPLFGGTGIDLSIVEVRHHERGFCGLVVSGPGDLPALESLRPSTLGIIVDDGTDRGQALACSCHPAGVAAWWGEREQERRG